MAFPKKGMRKIKVDDVTYAYKITGNDDYISLTIGLHETNGQILTGSFSYHVNSITHFNKDGTKSHWSNHQRIKITPETIRQTILFGLENGWNPDKNKGEIRLNKLEKDFENEIELNLKEATIFPVLKKNQVAIYFKNSITNQLLRINKQIYKGEGEIYEVYNNLQEAKKRALETISINQEVECWIMTEKDKAIYFLSTNEEKNYMD